VPRRCSFPHQPHMRPVLGMEAGAATAERGDDRVCLDQSQPYPVGPKPDRMSGGSDLAFGGNPVVLG
jgi:hypothetical protein